MRKFIINSFFISGDHAVSASLAMGRRPAGFATGTATGTVGADTSVSGILSPRGSDNGGLGVKMVEYVLGTSPTGKDSSMGVLDRRMGTLHLQDDKDKEKPAQSPKEQECNGGPTVVVVQNGQVGGGPGQDDDKGFK